MRVNTQIMSYASLPSVGSLILSALWSGELLAQTAAVSGGNKEMGVQIVNDHALIGKAENIPVSAPTPVVSVSPGTVRSVFEI